MMFLQDAIDTVFRYSDRIAGESGLDRDVTDRIVADSIGYARQSQLDLAAETPPIDTQSRVKRESALVFAMMLGAIAGALLERAGRETEDAARRAISNPLQPPPPSG